MQKVTISGSESTKQMAYKDQLRTMKGSSKLQYT